MVLRCMAATLLIALIFLGTTALASPKCGRAPAEALLDSQVVDAGYVLGWLGPDLVAFEVCSWRELWKIPVAYREDLSNTILRSGSSVYVASSHVRDGSVSVSWWTTERALTDAPVIRWTYHYTESTILSDSIAYTYLNTPYTIFVVVQDSSGLFSLPGFLVKESEVAWTMDAYDFHANFGNDTKMSVAFVPDYHSLKANGDFLVLGFNYSYVDGLTGAIDIWPILFTGVYPSLTQSDSSSTYWPCYDSMSSAQAYSGAITSGDWVSTNYVTVAASASSTSSASPLSSTTAHLLNYCTLSRKSGEVLRCAAKQQSEFVPCMLTGGGSSSNVAIATGLQSNGVGMMWNAESGQALWADQAVFTVASQENAFSVIPQGDSYLFLKVNVSSGVPTAHCSLKGSFPTFVSSVVDRDSRGISGFLTYSSHNVAHSTLIYIADDDACWIARE